jgi:endonuclease G
LNLPALADGSRLRRPVDLANQVQLDRRQRFLEESLGDTTQARLVYERIINGNELQDANYLERGARAARSVARIAIRDLEGRLIGWGTGFLVAPRVLITNNHVLPGSDVAAESVAQFRYELDADGRMQSAIPFRLLPSELFYTSPERDFTVVAVEEQSSSGGVPLSDFGYLPLVSTLGKVAEGEWLTIVQHPNGERKQLCVRENQLLKIEGDVLWYSTDTLGGSSGSPVHNNDWYVVALHHAGVPHIVNGKYQTVDGRDFDPSRDTEQSIKWIANEGIRVSRIVDELRGCLPGHPLLARAFDAKPAEARLQVPQALIAPAGVLPRRVAADTHPLRMETPMPDGLLTQSERRVTVTLGVAPDGRVRVVDERFERSAEVATEAMRRTPAFDIEFDPDYSGRAGFDADFLGTGDLRVQLPKLSDSLEVAAAELLKKSATNKYVLKYHNYSVVMHAERRLAIYSAANVDFANRFDMSRPADVWRADPRIRADAQLTNFYYRKNKFDRGHLTRREDLEFGKTWAVALASAADTCHWTNCVPQHERFNQNKELWQGIERYILEQSVKADKFRAQVITGPILAEDDPVWDAFPDVRYPVRFWKVVAAVNSNKQLFATAYILDQSEVVDRYGIEAAREVPFDAFKTFQVPIGEVERETGLTFHSGPDNAGVSLREVDPLKSPRKRSRRLGPRVNESSVAGAPLGYEPLKGLESIVLE